MQAVTNQRSSFNISLEFLLANSYTGLEQHTELSYLLSF